MRHQSKRKYADRKKLNRKYHSQKAYRKEQKRKTGWRARWDKFTDRLANIFEICFLLMIPIFIVYMIFFDDGVYKDGIYGLWQSENHKLAISYEDGSKGSKRDWDIVQDGNVLIKDARIDDIKRLEDGTLYIEVYAKENLFSDLPTKNGHNYLNMYVRKDHYLTYNGESYKSPFLVMYCHLLEKHKKQKVRKNHPKTKKTPLLLAKLDSHGVVVLF